MAAKLTGRTLRRAYTFPLDLSEITVTLRRVDLMNQWLLGKTEHALVSEVYAAERVLEHLDRKASTFETLESLTPEDRRTLLVGLRRFATIAVVSPRVTETDDGDEDAILVEMLGFHDLMAIWSATPPADVAVDPRQPVAVPAQEGGETARFSEAAAETKPSEPARDHAERTVGAGPSLAVPAERTPYHGLVSLTTH